MREVLIFLLMSCGFILAQASPKISYSSNKWEEEGQREIDERRWMEHKQRWRQIERRQRAEREEHFSFQKNTVILSVWTFGAFSVCCLASCLTAGCKKTYRAEEELRVQWSPLLRSKENWPNKQADLRSGL